MIYNYSWHRLPSATSSSLLDCHTWSRSHVDCFSHDPLILCPWQIFHECDWLIGWHWVWSDLQMSIWLLCGSFTIVLFIQITWGILRLSWCTASQLPISTHCPTLRPIKSESLESGLEYLCILILLARSWGQMIYVIIIFTINQGYIEGLLLRARQFFKHLHVLSSWSLTKMALPTSTFHRRGR